MYAHFCQALDMKSLFGSRCDGAIEKLVVEQSQSFDMQCISKKHNLLFILYFDKMVKVCLFQISPQNIIKKQVKTRVRLVRVEG